jgi:hypothetical protein
MTISDMTSHAQIRTPSRGRGVRSFFGVLGAVLFLIAATAGALAASVTTRSYDNGRTGWNKDEPVLNPSNVTPNTFHKIDELRVDDKIEASPLYIESVNTASGVRNLLIVATTNNTIFAFDATTTAQVWARGLGQPVQNFPTKTALYNWGITSTPVIDAETGTLYVARLSEEGGNKLYRLFGLNLFDGSDAIQSQIIDGFSVKRGSKFFVNGGQIVRTGLALWKNAAGQKAIVFGATGGESAFDPSGWVIAYNVAQLQAGGPVTPAVWCSSLSGGGAGIWMASQGIAIDESDPGRDIYFSTGNGPYNEIFNADNLGESVVRLHYDPNANTLRG